MQEEISNFADIFLFLVLHIKTVILLCRFAATLPETRAANHQSESKSPQNTCATPRYPTLKPPRQ